MSRVRFITGASRGLCLAITTLALTSGFSVIATARNPSSLDHLVIKYRSTILQLAFDVSYNASTLAIAAAGYKHFSRIHVLINNAGYADTTSIEDIPIENFLAQINTDFLGVVYFSKAVLPIMREQGKVHTMQFSSLGGGLGSPGLAAYQSAKWAAGGFSTMLTAEVKHLGI